MVYAVVGLVGVFIFVVTLVCMSVHVYHCCSRRRRKRSDAVADTCSRPSASSAAVDCQYVTLQASNGTVTAVPSAPVRDSADLQPVCPPAENPDDARPPSYDEVMGFQ